MMLHSLPVDDVPAAFPYLLDPIPDDIGLDPFMGFFMSTLTEGRLLEHKQSKLKESVRGDARKKKNIIKDRRVLHAVERYK